MMRFATWPKLLSLLAIAGGGPLLAWLGISTWTIVVAVGTAVAFIGVVSHVVGTYRVGHAI